MLGEYRRHPGVIVFAAVPLFEEPGEPRRAHVCIVALGDHCCAVIGRLGERPAVRVVEHDVGKWVGFSEVIEEGMIGRADGLFAFIDIIGTEVDHHGIGMGTLGIPRCGVLLADLAVDAVDRADGGPTVRDVFVARDAHSCRDAGVGMVTAHVCDVAVVFFVEQGFAGQVRITIKNDVPARCGRVFCDDRPRNGQPGELHIAALGGFFDDLDAMFAVCQARCDDDGCVIGADSDALGLDDAVDDDEQIVDTRGGAQAGSDRSALKYKRNLRTLPADAGLGRIRPVPAPHVAQVGVIWSDGGGLRWCTGNKAAIQCYGDCTERQESRGDDHTTTLDHGIPLSVSVPDTHAHCAPSSG